MIMAIDSDLPAFPAHPDTRINEYGLTKREYFAVMILQGMMAAENAQERSTVTRAIEMADILIEKLGG